MCKSLLTGLVDRWNSMPSPRRYLLLAVRLCVVAVVVTLMVTASSCRSLSSLNPYDVSQDWEERMSMDPVPMARLLSDPFRFHGTMVKVSGFLRLQHENNALYLSFEAARYGLMESAIYLLFKDSIYLSQPGPLRRKPVGFKSLDTLDKRYVMVQGIFDADFDPITFQLGLKNVDMVEPLNDWFAE